MRNEQFTRDWYMENSKERHHAYWLAVAERSGITIRLLSPKMLEGVKRSNDPYLNDIPLKYWDAVASFIKAIEIDNYGKKSYSLSSGVCALKAIAKQWKMEQEAA